MVNIVLDEPRVVFLVRVIVGKALETVVASFAGEAFDLKLYEAHLSDAYIDCRLRQAAAG